MNRRTFVALLGTITGCSAASSSDGSVGTSTRTPTQTPSSTEAATPAPTASPTATATETQTEEPPATDTETPTPSAREKQAADALETADAKLADVVETFTADYGSELTAVEAGSVDFLELDYELQLALADAQDAYTNAKNRAASAEQEELAVRMMECWQFLQKTRATQTEVVEGYVRLDRARGAFERAEPEVARPAIDELETHTRRGASRLERLVTESTVESASVISQISPEEYQNKLSQFEADLRVYNDLNGPLDRLAEGIKWFKLARLEFEKEDRNVQNAKEKAEAAEEVLEDAEDQLSSVIEAADDDTTLLPTLEKLRSIAKNKADIARGMDN